MSLNDIINRLAKEREERERKEEKQRVEKEHEEPLPQPHQMPTLRDLTTALYSQKQSRTCRNCIRRERGNCPTHEPHPKTCVSFAVNSRLMHTYGRQAKNMLEAIAEAERIARQRNEYYENKISNGEQPT